MGGTETAAFTLYCKLHTQALTQKAVAALEPHKPCSVYVCVCATAGPLGPVAQSDSHTHISPLTEAEHDAGWMGERLVDAD